MRYEVPISPVRIPAIPHFPTLILNSSIPTKRVNRGAVALMIPAKEESILEIPIANKKAGMADPKKPVRISHGHEVAGMVFHLGKNQGKSARQENPTSWRPPEFLRT